AKAEVVAVMPSAAMTPAAMRVFFVMLVILIDSSFYYHRLFVEPALPVSGLCFPAAAERMRRRAFPIFPCGSA
ncbi:hypothetical protein, partial [Serratia marcescens]|uniref:hypothetical protein n=1 Tax=Serratia marcescens TaxID=615 RepID=UPI002380C239